MTEIGAIYRPPWRSDFAELGLDLDDTCTHHCSYCYVKWDLRRKLYGPDALPLINKQLRDIALWSTPTRVHLSHFCDPYDCGRSDHSQIRKVLTMFKRYYNPFQILTKGGTKAVRDFDLYFEGCRFGCTLTFESDSDSLKWEPGAALPGDRIEALKQAHGQGIETWACLEPVIVPEQTLHLIELTHEFVDFYWVGKLNHNHELEDTIDWAEFLADAEELLKSLNKDYGIKYQLRKAANGKHGHVKTSDGVT
jgi:DNA repair photolyase